MKKLLTAFVLILCSVIVCSVCGCGVDNTEHVEDLKIRIDTLESANGSLQNTLEDYKNRIELLESDNDSLQDKIESLESVKPNVFWTGKEEYAQNETMTVYYGNKAVFEMTLAIDYPYASDKAAYIFGGVEIKSLLTDISGASILRTSYLEYDSNIAMYGSRDIDEVICYKGVKVQNASRYACGVASNVKNSKDVKLWICVPGTPFPMAYFKITEIYEP